jgi:hypothetical protein
MKECGGPGNGSHMYLAKEGTNDCKSCNKHICNTCIFTTSNDEMCCVECFASEQLVTPGGDFGGDFDHNKSPDEMVSHLQHKGYQFTADCPLEDIMDAYEAVINRNGAIFSEDILNEVSIPSHPTKVLKEVEEISSFDLSQGGRFVNDENLSLNQKVSILKIISELVNIKKPDESMQRRPDLYIL